MALALSLIMVFSFAVVPAFAAEDIVEEEIVVEEKESIADSFGGVIDSATDICDSFENKDYKGAFVGIF